MHTRTHARTHARTYARTHARTHTITHTDFCSRLTLLDETSSILSTSTRWPRAIGSIQVNLATTNLILSLQMMQVLSSAPSGGRLRYFVPCEASWYIKWSHKKLFENWPGVERESCRRIWRRSLKNIMFVCNPTKNLTFKEISYLVCLLKVKQLSNWSPHHVNEESQILITYFGIVCNQSVAVEQYRRKLSFAFHYGYDFFLPLSRPLRRNLTRSFREWHTCFIVSGCSRGARCQYLLHDSPTVCCWCDNSSWLLLLCFFDELLHVNSSWRQRRQELVTRRCCSRLFVQQ